jgi:hypothetical protein
LEQLPDAQRAHVRKAIKLNAEEGARVARTLAPVRSGKTKAKIATEYSQDGMAATVVVIDSKAPQAEKDRAYSIEHGRKKGDHGSTDGAHFVWNTRQYLAKKFKGRIKRAISKAVKEVANG